MWRNINSIKDNIFTLYARDFSFEKISRICSCPRDFVFRTVREKIDEKQHPELFLKFKKDRDIELYKELEESKAISAISNRSGYSKIALWSFFHIEDASDQGMIQFHRDSIIQDFTKGYSDIGLSKRYDIDKEVMKDFIVRCGKPILQLDNGYTFCTLAIGKCLKIIESESGNVGVVAKKMGIPLEDARWLIKGLDSYNYEELMGIKNYVNSLTRTGNMKGTGLPPEQSWLCLELKQQGLKNEEIATQMQIPQTKVSKCIGYFRKYGLVG